MQLTKNMRSKAIEVGGGYLVQTSKRSTRKKHNTKWTRAVVLIRAVLSLGLACFCGLITEGHAQQLREVFRGVQQAVVIVPLQNGYLFLDRAKFAASFAIDVEPEKAAFMAESQVPWGIEALNGTISEPAGNAKPSWYLIATEDNMIPPAAQRFMSKRAGSTVVEVSGSHAIYVSQPNAVASVVGKAAAAVRASAG